MITYHHHYNILFWTNIFLCSFVISFGAECLSPNENFTDYDKCQDINEHCELWATQGECEINPRFMYYHCAMSCGSCTNKWGIKQFIDEELEEEIKKIIDNTEEYMENIISQSNYDVVHHACQYRHSFCVYWTAIGKCVDNYEYMNFHCAPSCQTCEFIEYSMRCPVDSNEKNIFVPNELHSMFERIVKQHTGEKLKVLSRPYPLYRFPPDGGAIQGPWLLIIDDFVTPEECNHLIEIGTNNGYSRSHDVGEIKIDGSFDSVQSEGRTSSNSWCDDECLGNEHVQNVLQKIVNLTGIPTRNSEHLQLLKYQEGQFYQIHHDFIDHQVDRPMGPRILTVFLYLNTVSKGGGTDFPRLGLTVIPRQGRMIIWPSVYDYNLLHKEPRTYHQALPVLKGIKYGANAWIHLRDFQTPHQLGCT